MSDLLVTHLAGLFLKLEAALCKQRSCVARAANFVARLSLSCAYLARIFHSSLRLFVSQSVRLVAGGRARLEQRRRLLCFEQLAGAFQTQHNGRGAARAPLVGFLFLSSQAKLVKFSLLNTETLAPFKCSSSSSPSSSASSPTRAASFAVAARRLFRRKQCPAAAFPVAWWLNFGARARKDSSTSINARPSPH